MDSVERGNPFWVERKNVGDDLLERVASEPGPVDAGDVESGAVIADRASAGAAEQVKQTRSLFGI